MREDVSRKELLERVREFVKALDDECRDGALVLIEGARDLRALRRMGFRGEAMMLARNGHWSSLLDRASKHRKIVLLFDLDQEGKRLTSKAVRLLEARGVSADLQNRRRLAALGRGLFKCVEDLGSFASEAERETYLLPRTGD